MKEVSVRTISIEELVGCCQEEERRFSVNEPHRPEFCYELFRRAIVEDNQLAWTAIYYQYEPLVLFWLRRQASFSQTSQTEDALVNEAYTRFFKALQHISDETFCKRFANLAALLSFLARCAATAVLDTVRTQNRRREDKLVALPEHWPAAARTESLYELNEWQQRLLAQIKPHLQTFQEKVVFVNSYLLDVKAASILADYPDLFNHVQEIYNCRLRIVRRLRADEQLAQFLQ